MNKWESKCSDRKINRSLDIISAIICILLIVSTIIFWKNAPDIIPTHFGFDGVADAYGSKNTVFILLPITLIIYLGFTILSKYPQIYNYAIEINNKNREKQYNMATIFIRILNVEILGIFFYIQMKQLSSINSSSQNLSLAFLPISMIILFGTIGLYIYNSLKHK